MSVVSSPGTDNLETSILRGGTHTNKHFNTPLLLYSLNWGFNVFNPVEQLSLTSMEHKPLGKAGSSQQLVISTEAFKILNFGVLG